MQPETNLATLRPGDPVNLEADIIAKYVERILAFSGRGDDAATSSGLTLEKLSELGYK